MQKLFTIVNLFIWHSKKRFTFHCLILNGFMHTTEGFTTHKGLTTREQDHKKHCGKFLLVFSAVTWERCHSVVIQVVPSHCWPVEHWQQNCCFCLLQFSGVFVCTKQSVSLWRECCQFCLMAMKNVFLHPGMISLLLKHCSNALGGNHFENAMTSPHNLKSSQWQHACVLFPVVPLVSMVSTNPMWKTSVCTCWSAATLDAWMASCFVHQKRTFPISTAQDFAATTCQTTFDPAILLHVAALSPLCKIIGSSHCHPMVWPHCRLHNHFSASKNSTKSETILIWVGKLDFCCSFILWAWTKDFKLSFPTHPHFTFTKTTNMNCKTDFVCIQWQLPPALSSSLLACQLQLLHVFRGWQKLLDRASQAAAVELASWCSAEVADPNDTVSKPLFFGGTDKDRDRNRNRHTDRQLKDRWAVHSDRLHTWPHQDACSHHLLVRLCADVHTLRVVGQEAKTGSEAGMGPWNCAMKRSHKFSLRFHSTILSFQRAPLQKVVDDVKRHPYPILKTKKEG